MSFVVNILTDKMLRLIPLCLSCEGRDSMSLAGITPLNIDNLEKSYIVSTRRGSAMVSRKDGDLLYNTLTKVDMSIFVPNDRILKMNNSRSIHGNSTTTHAHTINMGQTTSFSLEAIL